MKRKRTLREIIYVMVLLVAIIILFHWYTVQNRERIGERNRNYAADSAQMKAAQIDEELSNALGRISTYSYFVGESLTEPMVTAQMLEKMEENAVFDAVLFTDREGVDYTSDGRTADVTGRSFYKEGMQGESDIVIIFDSYFFDEIMANFYAPVRYNGEIIGVLRGVYLAEEYLKDMLKTTYFGETADVFLCTPDGYVIASSDDKVYEGNLIDYLFADGVIDGRTAEDVKRVFENGGEGAFICDEDSKTDNICVTYLPENEYVLVQTFPKDVTQSMIRTENLVGIRLEMMLIILFIFYIMSLLVRARKTKKVLERENREMGYIIDGVTTLFNRFSLVDFENGTYQYLAGTRSEDENLAICGKYEELAKHLCSIVVEGSEREEFAAQLEPEALQKAFEEQEDVRFERHVLRDGREEWEHANVMCVERKDGRAVKALLTRQNITEVKEKELRIQAQMSLANRKERQYRIAVASSAFSTFELNRPPS